MFKILFTLLPTIFCGAIGFYTLYTRWVEEYAAPVTLADLTRKDWVMLFLFAVILVMIGLTFNLLASALGGI